MTPYELYQFYLNKYRNPEGSSLVKQEVQPTYTLPEVLPVSEIGGDETTTGPTSTGKGIGSISMSDIGKGIGFAMNPALGIASLGFSAVTGKTPMQAVQDTLASMGIGTAATGPTAPGAGMGFGGGYATDAGFGGMGIGPGGVDQGVGPGGCATGTSGPSTDTGTGPGGCDSGTSGPGPGPGPDAGTGPGGCSNGGTSGPGPGADSGTGPGGCSNGGGGDGGDGGGGTYVCTASYANNLITPLDFRTLKQYGIKLRKNDKYLMKAYDWFGPKLASAVKKGKLINFAKHSTSMWKYDQTKQKDVSFKIKLMITFHKLITRPIVRTLGVFLTIKEKITK